MGRFGSAVSTDPDLETAVAAAVAGAQAALGGAAVGLAVVFVSPDYGAAAAEAGPRVHAAVAPQALVGAVAVSGVIGRAREVEAGPAVSVLLAAIEGVEPIADDRVDLGAGRVGVLLADPYTCDLSETLAILSRPVVGGLAGGGGPGEARLFQDGDVRERDAVGVSLPDECCSPLVSQGCRPIGPDLVITAAERNAVLELAGKPALEKLHEIFGQLPAADRAVAAQGLLAGTVVDANRPDYEVGDFLIRVIVGVDRASGAILIGDRPRVGQTFRFHVRDAASAGVELEAVLRDGAARGGDPGGAIVFSCNGRGVGMFGCADHDASLVESVLGVPVAGLFCQGEIGPVGRINHLHGFTATVALLR